MSRKPLLAANWKMHMGIEDTIKFFTQLTRSPLNVTMVDIVVCPPFTTLYTASVTTQDAGVQLGAQNCYFEDSGAYTGEISPAFLKEIGCAYVIIGHSERRQIFKESDEDIAKKLKKALEHELTPIFCVGETEAERNAGKTFAVVETQLRQGLALLERTQIEKLVIAYEPVWAIGTGNTATPAQAQEVHASIREFISRTYGTSYGSGMRILYGGSVKPDNIRALLREADIDGGLIGGASLKADQFLEIIRESSTVSK